MYKPEWFETSAGCLFCAVAEVSKLLMFLKLLTFFYCCRLSFPSGHASGAMYAMVFLAVSTCSNVLIVHLYSCFKII